MIFYIASLAREAQMFGSIDSESPVPRPGSMSDTIIGN
jgi:hypothetical protein